MTLGVVVRRLCCTHEVPVVPVVPVVPLHEVGTAVGFWSKARKRFAAAGVEIKRDIRTADQEEEKLRWQHLVPESENERSIRKYWEWLTSEHAVGRVRSHPNSFYFIETDVITATVIQLGRTR